MKKELDKKERARLDRVRAQFKSWRAKKQQGREPIPDRLWKAASGLVGPVPITMVERELGVESSKLRRKVEQHRVRPRPAGRKKERLAAFVEVTVPSVVARGMTQVDTTAAGSAVEFERPDGTRLRLSGAALRGLDLVALVGQFTAPAATQE